MKTEELVGSFQDILNNGSYLTDPYPGSRSGLHFFTEFDGINLKRRDTFPKGFIRCHPISTENSGFGSNDQVLPQSISLDIFYYVVEGTKELSGSRTNEGYVIFMIDNIKDAIIQNQVELRRNDIHLEKSGIDTTEPVHKYRQEGSEFNLFWSVLSVKLRTAVNN